MQYQDYYPYGMIMPGRNGTSGKGSRYGFQGQETDDEVAGKGNSVNFTFRMHEPRLGRFFTMDPLASTFAWNSPYAFSENRVTDAIELEGLELYPIHGTWGDNNETWGINKDNPALSTPLLVTSTRDLFNNSEIIIEGWSGYNTDEARRSAALEYVQLIKETRIDGEPITILAHSHGGNVGIIVLNILAEDPDFDDVELNLVSMNTPVREYQLSEKALGKVNHYQIYNTKDPVQAAGGNSIILGSGKKKIGGEFGWAGRTFESATNIEYTSQFGILNQHHTGWDIRNVKAWFGKLKEAKTQNETSSIGSSSPGSGMGGIHLTEMEQIDLESASE